MKSIDKESVKSILARFRFIKYLVVSISLIVLLIIFVKSGGGQQFYSTPIITLYWILFFLFTIISLGIFCYWQAERSEKKLLDFTNKVKENENLTTSTLLEISENENIRNICKNYIKSFLPSSIHEKEKTRSNADLYFGYVSWLEDTRNGYPVLQALKIIPGTFTGFGILGTFLGFANGVSQINTNGNFETMKSGIDNLLSGLNIAFNSSIFGVVASILINFIIIQPIIHRLQIESKGLCDYLDEKFYISEADAIMQYSVIVDEDNNHIPFSMSLKAITDSLNDVRSAMDKFTSEIADKLVNMQKEATMDVSNSLQSVLKENVTGQFDVLRENVNKTSEILKACADILQDVPEKLTETSEKLIESTKISLEEFKMQSETSIENLNHTIQENLNKHFDRYAGMINESTETIIDLNNAIKLVPDNLRDINEAISQTKDSMQESVQQLEIHLENVSVSVDKLGELYKVFENSSVLENEKFNQLVEQFSGLYNSYQAVNNECQGMLKEFKSMDSQLTDIYTTINNNTEKYSEVVGSSLNNYLNGFASAAQEFSSGLSSAVNSLSTTLEETKNAANIMSTSLEAYIKIQDENKRVTK